MITLYPSSETYFGGVLNNTGICAPTVHASSVWKDETMYEKHKPENLLLWNQSSGYDFFSDKESRPFFMFDLHNCSLLITNYSYKNFNYAYPKEWELSVSLDMVQWKIVDYQNLTSKSKSGVFQTANEYARFIKFTQITGFADRLPEVYSKTLCMTRIEFFGIIGPLIKPKTACVCHSFYIFNYILLISPFIFL